MCDQARLKPLSPIRLHYYSDGWKKSTVSGLEAGMWCCKRGREKGWLDGLRGWFVNKGRERIANIGG